MNKIYTYAIPQITKLTVFLSVHRSIFIYFLLPYVLLINRWRCMLILNIIGYHIHKKCAVTFYFSVITRSHMKRTRNLKLSLNWIAYAFKTWNIKYTISVKLNPTSEKRIQTIKSFENITLYYNNTALLWRGLVVTHKNAAAKYWIHFYKTYFKKKMCV